MSNTEDNNPITPTRKRNTADFSTPQNNPKNNDDCAKLKKLQLKIQKD